MSGKSFAERGLHDAPADLAIRPDAPLHSVATDGRSSQAAYARAIVKKRARIGRYFNPNLFADPAFDIMLDLYAAAEEGREVNISSCAHVARVPDTTGYRHVLVLEREGLVERFADPRDKRRVLLRLTPHAHRAMTLYLADISAIPLRPMD